MPKNKKNKIISKIDIACIILANLIIRKSQKPERKKYIQHCKVNILVIIVVLLC